MKLHQLRCFLAVIDERSFTKAARRVGKSQQALSKCIRSLEESLGASLLQRDARMVSVTSYGELLLPAARRMVSQAEFVFATFSRMLRTGCNRARIGADTSAATRLVSEAVLRLAKRLPELQISVIAGSHQTFLQEALAGELDLFVCVDDGEEESTEILSEIVFHAEYRIVAGRSNPLTKRTSPQAEQFHAANWLLGCNLGGLESDWRRAFEQAGLHAPVPRIETTSIEFAKSALQSGDYLAVMSSEDVETEIERGDLQFVDVPGFSWRKPISLHYTEGGSELGHVAAVIDEIRRASQMLHRFCIAA